MRPLGRLVALALLILCSGARAQDMGRVLSIVMSAPVTDEHRRLLASQLGSECSRINRLVPELSPRESDWLASEIESGRTDAAMHSTEFAHRALRTVFSKCEKGAAIAAHSDPRASRVGWVMLAASTGELDVETYMNRSSMSSLNANAGRAASLRLFSIPILDNIVTADLLAEAAAAGLAERDAAQ